jgi:hypothetical protein
MKESPVQNADSSLCKALFCCLSQVRAKDGLNQRRVAESSGARTRASGRKLVMLKGSILGMLIAA